MVKSCYRISDINYFVLLEHFYTNKIVMDKVCNNFADRGVGGKDFPQEKTIPYMHGMFPCPHSFVLLIIFEEHMKKFILSFCLLFAFVTCANAASTPQEIRDDVFPVINKGIDELLKNKDVRKRTVTEILTFRDPKFERLIAECFEIMADSPFVELMETQEQMQKDIQKKQDKIQELARQSFTAPEESWNPFATTQKSIIRDTERLNAEIAQVQANFIQKKDAVFQHMKDAGVPITREQFDLMINAVDTVDQSKIMAVAENLKYINKEIEQKAADPNAPLDLIKMYTGVYMMSYKIYLYGIEEAMNAIQKQYLPKLKHMKEINNKLYANSMQLLSEKQTEADQKLLKNNISQQERMVSVINLYEKYLAGQYNRLDGLAKNIDKRFKVAQNTFYTIRLSSELLGLIHTTESDFSQIFAFQPAELSLLYEERLRSEFMEVSKKLKVSE